MNVCLTEDMPIDPISSNWINSISVLGLTGKIFVQLTEWQEWLFDQYIIKFDKAINNALLWLDTLENDPGLSNDFDELVFDMQKISDRFLSEIYSTMGQILIEMDTNQELLVAFYVFYCIYTEMNEENHLCSQMIHGNPIFYRALKDFSTIYSENVLEDLPLPEECVRLISDDLICCFSSHGEI